MKPNKNQTKYVLGALLALASFPNLSRAQIPPATEYFDRSHKTEFYGVGQYLHSDDITYNGPLGDVKIKMDDLGLGGFGFAYHFNPFVSIHSDFMFGNTAFHGDFPVQNPGPGTPTTISVKQDAFITTGRFNVDYNMINRRISPLLTAGIGYQYLETELKNLPPVNYCWWDPWYGYICGTGYAYASETDFTWNVGAGFRWNITDNLIVKVVGGANWLEYGGNAHGVTTQIEGIFSIGWMF
jgi:opacity protein-like surface antigen